VYNNGQSCCAVERIYVQEGVYDAFVQSYVEQLGRWWWETRGRRGLRSVH